MSILLASRSVKAVSWTVASSDAAGAPTPQTATIEFFANGLITSSSNPDDKWYAALMTSIGNDFEIQATLISGTGVTGDFGVWSSLSVSRSWSLSNSSPGLETATIELSIRKAGEVPVMHTGQIIFTAEVTP